MSSPKRITRLFKKLLSTKKVAFPRCGYNFCAPLKKGVYIIYNKNSTPVHVGCSPRAKDGLKQRLDNHLNGQSSFVGQFLKGNCSLLRKGYNFRCLPVKDPRERKYLEALTIGKLCPKHIGKG